MSRSRSRSGPAREALRAHSVLVRVFLRFHEGRYSSFKEGVEALMHATNSGASGPQLFCTDQNAAPRITGQGMAGEIELAIPNDVLRNNSGVSMLMAIAGYYSSYAGVKSYGIERVELCGESVQVMDLRGPGASLVPPSDVAVGAIMKPRFASTMDKGLHDYVDWCTKAGFDLLVEDELTSFGTVDQVVNRVRSVVDIAVSNASKTRYVANLTRRPLDAVAIAERLETVPQCAIMMNVVTMGIDVVQEVRARSAVPIVANVVGRGMVAGGNDFYVREEVLCRLARLSGADAVYTGPFVGSIETDPERAERLCTALSGDIVEGHTFASAAAVMAGGLDLMRSYQNIQKYDGPVILLWGSEAHKLQGSGMSPRSVSHALEVLREDAAETELEMKELVKRRLRVRGRDNLADQLARMGID